MNKLERAVRSVVVLAAAAAGLSGSQDIRPHSLNWYVWGVSGLNGRGCSSVWVLQSHEVVPSERVVLDISPAGADSIEIDLSGKPVNVFIRKVCAPAASGIIFTAQRDGIQGAPSVFSPTP